MKRGYRWAQNRSGWRHVIAAHVCCAPRWAARSRIGPPTARSSKACSLPTVGSGSTTKRGDRTLALPVSGTRSATYRASAASIAGTALSPTGTAIARFVAEKPSATVRYAKAWASARTPGATGSSIRRTTALRGKVSITVTARSVGLLLQRGPKNGKAAVYLDGRKVAVLDLRAGSASTRIAWASALTTTRSHTISVVNLSKGKRLGVDGLVGLQ